MISCFFNTRVRGSVTPLMYDKDAKKLRDMGKGAGVGGGGWVHHFKKNIPNNSSGEGTVEDWVFLVWTS